MAATWPSILGIAAIAACVPTAYSLLYFGGSGTLSLDALPGALFVVLMALVAAVAIATSVRREDAIPRLWIAALLAWIVIDAIALGVWFVLGQVTGEHVPNWVRSAAFYAPLLWLCVATARFGGSLAQGAPPRRALAFVLALIFMALPLSVAHPDRSLWIKDWSSQANGYEEERKARQAAAQEDAIYGQPAILAAELGAVEPGRKGIVDVFFIGMAGYGHEDVFMREVDKVAQLMRDRFDADGHIVKLVNNPKTVYSSPIASVTSLKAALRRVAAQMDVEEDVLVLFLTSHGSADHKFSLILSPLQFKDLTPATLRDALDESGIRNRVIIVSACYAGGFVERLKDERSLVIAAAASDRNSFGCGNESEWTYFGQAFFDKSLRETRSFTRAFEKAAVAIEAREKEGGHDPSRPMMAEGSAIRAKLAQLEMQLSQPAAPPENPVKTAQRDIYERYVDSTFTVDLVADSARSCRANMRLTSPDAWLEKDRNAFGGLDRSNPLWPRLVKAWDRHAEEFCSKANDPELIKRLYTEELRAVMSPEALAPAVGFLDTPEGRAWMEKDKEANRLLWARIGKVQARLSESSYAKYVDDQTGIMADYRSASARH